MTFPRPPSWWPVFLNIPTTQTWIAFALLGALYYILTNGVKTVDPDIIDLVKNLLTLIVGFYFAKASDQRNSDRDAMLIAAGTGSGGASIDAPPGSTVEATVTPPEQASKR